MLHPRETDLPGLFIVFIVLPIIAYILLGKWSEVSKKKDKVRILAEIAVQESLRVEAMVAANVVPLVPLPKVNNIDFHECARCFSPATTRCSRCKTVRYCSGKCQILHWRQVHKHECQLLELNSDCSSPKSASNEEFVSVYGQASFSDNLDSQCFESNTEQHEHDKPASDEQPDLSSGPTSARKSSDKRNRCKLNREIDALNSSADACSTSYDSIPLKETSIRHKSKRSHCAVSKSAGIVTGPSDSITSAQNGSKSSDMEMERCLSKKVNIAKSRSHSSGSKAHKLAKSTVEVAVDQVTCSGTENMGQIMDELDVSRMRDVKGSGLINKGFMKMIGLKKSSKHGRAETSEVNVDKHKKIKMLFPYEEFLKYFQYEVFDFSPRGLVNCGNR